ncbi:hypothetical protein GCM10025865_23770 [Paraoerskovia sediminicola]|uniref:YdbS-like PH domain-containing protein n=1 Tax=Paraoerskovia sediminicola TaxID=1138587 RepID=A0ABM8G4J0_9CELL|nr:PH domain-containing protein [Paraoerskovia sediminicola]BDZ43078.1 hypothetical protein GCM10025865_23770 [Paraoerskovia sediminicola]
MAPDHVRRGAGFVWFLAIPLAARAVWRLVHWRVEWFVATDKRILLVYSLFIDRVSMMPVRKVTDMVFDRSFGGQILGYGEFVFESAGQDQALHKIKYVDHPQETYEALGETLFGSSKGPDKSDEELDDAMMAEASPPAAPQAAPQAAPPVDPPAVWTSTGSSSGRAGSTWPEESTGSPAGRPADRRADVWSGPSSAGTQPVRIDPDAASPGPVPPPPPAFPPTRPRR